MTPRLYRAAMLALVGLLAACAPSPPLPLQSPGQLPPSAGSSAVPSTTLGFRDDFDGDAVSPNLWSLHMQSGLAVVKDGQVELLNSGRQPNFPYLLSKSTIIPQAGPWFFEMKLSSLVAGTIHFALDYLPAEAPGQQALTDPFLLVNFTRTMVIQADVEGKKLTAKPLTLKLQTPYVFRVEGDGQDNTRVIFDGTEVLRFTSTRRPMRFWFGQYPLKDVTPRTWPRVLIDYVAAGVLASPAPAAPLPSASPAE